MSLQTMPSDADLRLNRADDVQALEEDTRLRNDIRLLGRILGYTVRDQEGGDVFEPGVRALIFAIWPISLRTRTPSARCARMARRRAHRAPERSRTRSRRRTG